MNLVDTYRRLYAHCNSDRAPTVQEEINYLYGILGVLDSKASALMRFDAIMIAAASFLLLQGGDKVPLASAPRLQVLLGAILVASLAAAGFCLCVVQVSYPFLGKILIDSDSIDCSAETRALNSAAERRTRFYRLAWWLSVIAVLIFVVVGLAIALT